jgi:hypothetical protein
MKCSASWGNCIAVSLRHSMWTMLSLYQGGFGLGVVEQSDVVKCSHRDGRPAVRIYDRSTSVHSSYMSMSDPMQRPK